MPIHPRSMKVARRAGLGVWVAAVASTLLLGCPGTRPDHLGATNGLLAPCPSSPNCVSDRATDDQHRIAPLTFAGSPADAMAKLVGIIQSTPRTEIVIRRDDYLYVEFTSLLWRFVDDVELLFDPDGRTIHVRSASRLGEGDLGANRRRIEDIRVRLRAP